MKKRADGRYCKQIFVGYKSNGKRKLKTIYGKTIKEVEKKERDILIEIDKGVLPTEDVSIEAWSDKWLKTFKSNLSYYTFRRYKSIINVHIKPNLGHFPLTKLKLDTVQMFINNLSEEYSMSTIKKVRDAIHQMYTAAIANDLAFKDPTIGLILPRKQKNEREILSDDEIHNITKFSSNSPLGTFVMTLLYTGMRRGEIVALTWSDIDFEKKEIYINKAVEFKNNRPHVKPPKTANSIRVIPIVDNIFDILVNYKKEYIDKHGQNIKHQTVFLNSLGEPHTESSLGKYWKKFLKDYNEFLQSEEEVKFNMHQFRHTFCTLLYNADVDVKSAQAILGHSDISVTLGIYTHLEEKQKKLSIDKLNNYLVQLAKC